jgi:hypothetical protein
LLLNAMRQRSGGLVDGGEDSFLIVFGVATVVAVGLTAMAVFGELAAVGLFKYSVNSMLLSDPPTELGGLSWRTQMGAIGVHSGGSCDRTPRCVAVCCMGARRERISVWSH